MKSNVGFKCDPALKDELQNEADKLGITISQYVSELCAIRHSNTTDPLSPVPFSEKKKIEVPAYQDGHALRGYMVVLMYGTSSENIPFKVLNMGVGSLEIVGACEAIKQSNISATYCKRPVVTTPFVFFENEPPPVIEQPTAVVPQEVLREVTNPFFALGGNSVKALAALHDKNGTTAFSISTSAHKKIREKFGVSNIIPPLQNLQKRGLVEMKKTGNLLSPWRVRFLFAKSDQNDSLPYSK